MSKEKENQLGKISRRTFLSGAAAMGGVLGIGAMSASAGTGPLDADSAIFGEAQHAGFDLPVREVDEPTYTKDIVGEYQRYDARETPLFRGNWEKGSAEYIEYYKKHPEKEKYFEELKRDMSIYEKDLINSNARWSNFNTLQILGAEDIVDGPVSPRKLKMEPEIAAEKIKGFCKSLGSDLVRIGPCNDKWLYSHRENGEKIDTHYDYSVNIALTMDYDMISTGIDVSSELETGRAYAQIAFITVTVAHFIRSLGYRARANHSSNYLALCVPLSIDAGLGELSRMGYLLCKEYGANIRLGNILTDLPMAMDKPVDIGVQDFCNNCGLCAEWCPSGSIGTGPKVERNGVMRWEFNDDSCAAFWNTGTGGNCSRCVVACPWSKPPSWIHSMAVESASHSKLARRLLPDMEKIVYGVWQDHEPPRWITNTWITKPDWSK